MLSDEKSTVQTGKSDTSDLVPLLSINTDENEENFDQNTDDSDFLYTNGHATGSTSVHHQPLLVEKMVEDEDETVSETDQHSIRQTTGRVIYM